MAVITDLRAENESLKARVQELNEENLKLNAKLGDARTELRKLRAWWRALKGLAGEILADEKGS